MRTAKACGPGALAAGAKPVEGDSAGDGDTTAGLAGASTQEPVNTIAQGMPMLRLDCSDYAHVLFYLHMRLWVRPGTRHSHGIPCALSVFEGGLQSLGHFVPREC